MSVLLQNGCGTRLRKHWQATHQPGVRRAQASGVFFLRGWARAARAAKAEGPAATARDDDVLQAYGLAGPLVRNCCQGAASHPPFSYTRSASCVGLAET